MIVAFVEMVGAVAFYIMLWLGMYVGIKYIWK